MARVENISDQLVGQHQLRSAWVAACFETAELCRDERTDKTCDCPVLPVALALLLGLQ